MNDTAALIDNPEALGSALQSMTGAPFLAMDTEFLRESTYYPRLCLVQLATPDGIWLIDPLAIDDLSPLWTLLAAWSRPLVLHSGEQDLELMHLACGRLPENLFDTQMAAALLGLGEQIGYAGLVQELCAVQLDKSHSRTDWSRRPLDAQQLDYAADDVRYLVQLYPLLQERLATLGRENWLDDDFAALADPERFQVDDEAQWRRVKGHQKLRGRQLAALRALAAWRERTAREADCPRRWVLPDELLVDLARSMPRNTDQMARFRGWPQGALSRHGAAVLEAIRLAVREDPSQWPKLERGDRPTPDEEALLALLQATLRYRAASQNISVGSLSSSGDLLALLRGERNLPLLKGWRAHVIGDILLQVLGGHCALTVRAGRVEAIDLTDTNDRNDAGGQQA
ncbi:MAG: ribonuclease D [Halothiobacillaceae bacterium]